MGERVRQVIGCKGGATRKGCRGEGAAHGMGCRGKGLN